MTDAQPNEDRITLLLVWLADKKIKNSTRNLFPFIAGFIAIKGKLSFMKSFRVLTAKQDVPCVLRFVSAYQLFSQFYFFDFLHSSRVLSSIWLVLNFYC